MLFFWVFGVFWVFLKGLVGEKIRSFQSGGDIVCVEDESSGSLRDENPLWTCAKTDGGEVLETGSLSFVLCWASCVHRLYHTV